LETESHCIWSQFSEVTAGLALYCELLAQNFDSFALIQLTVLNH